MNSTISTENLDSATVSSLIEHGYELRDLTEDEYSNPIIVLVNEEVEPFSEEEFDIFARFEI